MELELVSPGDFMIESSGGHRIFEALLLTCVGVAIYDKHAGVGGLCHILLPDFPDSENCPQPRIYASSCLNLFIDELLTKGAERGRLEAVVAGGALGIPVTQYDLNLDIGGRICACVYTYLQHQSIPVKKSETGGVVGMKICVNTASWQVTIAYAFPADDCTGKVVKPSPEKIRDAIIHVKPIPQIALKL